MSDLFTEYRKTKSIALRNEIVTQNMRIAYKLAGQLYHQFRGKIPLDDLVSECSIVLIRAVEDFDPSRGFKFSTFAYAIIRRHVMHSIKQVGLKRSQLNYRSYNRIDIRGKELSESIIDKVSTDPQERVAGNEITEILMSKLNPKYQRILSRILDGWTDIKASEAESLGRGNGYIVRKVAADHLTRLCGNRE